MLSSGELKPEERVNLAIGVRAGDLDSFRKNYRDWSCARVRVCRYA